MSDRRKRILVCIDWYEPGYKAGGPIRSVVNLITALKDDYEFYVLTSAYDLGDNQPYPGIDTNQWHDRDGVFVRYMDRRALTMPSIKVNIREIGADLIYLNSLFSPLFTLGPLQQANRLGTPVVLAPRGMLGKGALDIKRGKKRFFLTVAKFFGFYRNVTWHASTVQEEKEIRDVFGRKARVIVAQNIPVAQTGTWDEIREKKTDQECRLVFVSRISVKKNLDMAIRAVKKVKANRPLFFDIYGTPDDELYFQGLADELISHENITIAYRGVLDPAGIAEVYKQSSFLVLPTRHENYGHAIVEAWANACPVIISQYTPWQNLRAQNLGWDVDITNEENLVSAIQKAVDLDYTSYLSMASACHAYFAEKICDPQILEANRTLFA